MATVDIEGWRGSWSDDDPHASFKARVAASARVDPLSTLGNLSQVVGVPVGGLVHHVLAEWAAAGSAALLELGPSEVDRLLAIVEDTAPAEERLERLRGRLSWLRSGT